MRASEASAGLELQEAPRFGGLALTMDDLVVVGGRLEPEREVMPGRERREPGQAREDLVELERAEGVRIHATIVARGRQVPGMRKSNCKAVRRVRSS